MKLRSLLLALFTVCLPAALSAAAITDLVSNAIATGTSTDRVPFTANSAGVYETFIFTPPTVTLSVNNATIAEAAGSSTVTATLSATAATNTIVTLSATGTATGGGTDYTLASTTITITAGNLTGTTTVTAVQDALDEANETVILDISGVTGGGGATESGSQQVTVTITDDDPSPALSIANVSLNEGNSGSTNMTFTVTLSPASGRAVSVDYATSNGTATAGTDYTAASGTLNFAAGETTKTFTVAISGDTTVEVNEMFTATLSAASNATISTATATGTITNDDILAADIPITLTSGALTIDASGAAGAANVTLRYVTGAGGPFLEITDTSRTLGVPAGGSAVNSNTVRVPLSSFTSLVLNGSPLADTFSFDVGGGDFFPSGGITVNGGAPSTPPGDVIDVVGTLASLDYDATNVGAGTVDLGIGTLVFTGIEPLDFSGATITGTVTIDVDPGNTFAGNIITTIAAVDAGVNTEVTFGSSGLESIKLGAVTGAVVINGDNVEQDYFVLSGLGSAMAGDFTIDGKGGDGDVIEVPTTSIVTVAGVDKTTTLRADFIGVGRDTTTITTRGILNVKGPLTLEATGAFDNASATPIWGPVGGIWGASVPTQFQSTSFNLSQRGCIVIRGELNKTGGAAATIAVRAAAGISMAGTGGQLNAAGTGGSIVSTSNMAHIILNADRDADNVGMVQIGGSGALTSNGGNITIGGGINPLTTPTRGFLAGTFYASGFLMTTASINSGGGDISIRGQGMATSFAAQGHGLYIGGVGNTMASGAGSLTLVGTATPGTSGAPHGIFIQGLGTGSNNISSTTGALSVSGTGTAMSASHGLQFTGTSTAPISITTEGAATLNGTAMSGGVNHGINFTSNVNVSATSTGTVAATGSTAGTGFGINLAPATGTTSGFTTAGDSLTLTADKMALSAGAGTESLSAGTGGVTLKPLTAAVAIDLGSAVDTTASTLELGTTELDTITASTLTIGDSSSGAINVSAVIAPLGFKTLALARNTTFSAIGGFTSDVTSATVFEKVSVTGTVNIQSGAALTMASAGGYIWNGTDTFTILDNDLADAITGTFSGPALTTFLGSALTAQQSYAAGTGNDLVFSAPPSANADLSALSTTATGLTPGFGAATLTYNATVLNATTTTTVTATRAQANATLQVQVNSGGFSPLTTGVASGPLSLNVGANTIDVKVTAQDGTTNKTYTITVTRAAPAAPDAPTVGTATAGTNVNATVTFTAPASDGGSPITSYSVTSAPGGVVNVGATSPITISGLNPGIVYTFRVQAFNAIGPSALSAASNSITAVSAPGAPTSPVATPGNASASVAFTAPASNGGAAITSYTVTSSPGGFTGTGAASPISVSGLTNGTAYTFTVRATNVAGPGPASAASAAVTPSTVPGAPTSPVATAGNASASVAFVAPASNGGSAITSYTVTSSPGGLTGTGAASPISVTGLTNGTAYTFTVTATNAAGPGAASVPSAAVTPATVPNAPTLVVATPGNASASVAFSLFDTGGSPILSFTVTSSPGGFTGTGISSPISVTGLTNGTAYTFTVTATNAAGTGAASVPSAAVTPRTVPGAPTSPVATPGNASASVAFSAPASDGGSAITSYTVTSNPGSITGTGAASPVTVTGLTNGTPYTFTVTATNVAGPGPASAASASVTPSVPAVMNNYVVTTIADSDPAGWSALELSTGKINGTNTVSLRSAVLAANRSGVGPHTISVPAALGTYVLSQTNPTNAATFSTNGGTDLVVGSHGSAITIQGTGGKAIIQRGTGGGAGDVITTGLKADGFTPAIVNLTLDSLDITGGTFTAVFTGADDGLGNVSRTTISNSTLRSNTNTDAGFGQGGAIQNTNGFLTISNTIFTSNTATSSGTGQGGAIYYSLPNSSGQGSVGALSITGCTFTSNTSALAGGLGGGAIYAQILSAGTNTTISGCTFTSNSTTAGADGGAIVLDGTRAATVTNNDFTTNSVVGAAGKGGAIAINNGAADINFNRFAGNTATTAANGTAIFRSATATGTVNANNNWWQSNAGPATNALVGTVTQASRINLKLVASPITVAQNTASALTADFFTTSSASTLTLPQVSTLIGRTVSFGSAVLGTYSGSQTTVQTAGTATSTFTSGMLAGAGSASVTIDGETATAAITVTGPPPTTVTSLNRVNPATTNLATVNWVLTFATANTGATASNFSLSGTASAGATVGTPTTANSGLTWNVPVTTGGTNGPLTLSLANSTGLTLGVTNAPFAGETYSMDKTAPTAGIVVTDASLLVGETSLVTITFSEAVSGFDNADLTIPNGALTPVISGDGGITWTATFTPSVDTEDATNVIALAMTGVADAAGNAGTGTTDSNNFVIDTLRPTVTLTSPVANPAPNVAFTLTATFSEPVTGFASGDIVFTNSVMGTFTAVSTTVYTAVLIPDGSGLPVTANVAANAANDAGGNGSTAATPFTRATYTKATISAAFGSAQVAISGTATLTYTLTNPNPSLALTGVEFTDLLPDGLALATTPVAANNLGGTLTAAASTRAITLSGGTLDPGETATVVLNITGTVTGVKTSNFIIVTSAEAPNITTQDVFKTAGNRVPTFAAPPLNISRLFHDRRIITGAVDAADPTQTGRINRFTVISEIGVNKAFPGMFTTSGARNFESHNIVNSTASPQDVNLWINTSGTGGFVVAYLDSFDPVNPATNYLADSGSSWPNTAYMGFTIPAGRTAVIVVHSVNSGVFFDYALGINTPLPAGAVSTIPATLAAQPSIEVIEKSVSIAAAAASAAEGTLPAGNTAFNFTVSRTGATTGTVTLDYAVSGTAVNAVDFGGTLPSGTVTIPDGSASTTLAINVSKDTTVEVDEDFTVTLSNPTNGYLLTTATASSTITNDDSATVTLAKVNDGVEAASATNALFRVTQTAPSHLDTVLTYTVGGTATSGSDFTALSGSVTILAGNTTADISVAVLNENLVEPTETVSLTLTGFTARDPEVTLGATLTASADITDSDTSVITLAKVNADQNEGTGGASTAFTFSATLSNPVQGGFSLAYTTNDGTALAASDYTDNDSTLTYTGTASESKTITVLVTHDGTNEIDEAFTVALGAITGTTLGGSLSVIDSPQTGTIRNDDALTVTITAPDADADENTAGTGTYRVSRNSVLGNTTVQLAIDASSSAVAADWTQSGATFASLAPSSAGTAIIPDGSTFVDITLTPSADLHAEAAETVRLNVTADAAYTVGSPANATVTIGQNDFVVINTNDAGEGTLRQAVLNANALAGDDTITFDATAFATAQTITLTSGQIVISSNVIVEGTRLLTLNGNATSRIFNISGATVILSDLTLTNGSHATSWGGALNVVNGSFVTVQRCTVSDSTSALQGGGIYVNNGTLNLVSSTVSGNTASTVGGGAIATGTSVANATVNVINSTISGNTGDNGGAMLFGSNAVVSLLHTTVTNNTSAQGPNVWSGGGAVTVANSIIAANQINTGHDDVGGAFTSSGGNLIGLGGGATGFTHGTNNDQFGTGTPINPLLGPLQDNGGPTLTHMPLNGSPAINNGLVANLPLDTNDQRGAPNLRQRGPAPDAGAVEAFAFEPTLTVATTDEDVKTTSGLVITANSADGDLTTHYQITSILNGTLYKTDGSTVIAGNSFITKAEGLAGLKFLPDSNKNDPNTATGFGFTAQAAISAAEANLRGETVDVIITVNPVADTPTVTGTFTVTSTQSTDGLVITRNAVDSTEVTHFKITNILNGTLYQNDGTTVIAANSFITVAQGGAGLKFTPAGGFVGTTSFTVQGAVDNAGTGLSPTTSAEINVGYPAPTITVLGPLVLNRSNGLYEHTVRITNAYVVPMTGFRLTNTNLVPNVEMFNRTHPYLPVIEDQNDLGANANRLVLVRYYSATRDFLPYTPTYTTDNLTDPAIPSLPADISGTYHGLVGRSSVAMLTTAPKMGGRLEFDMTRSGGVTGKIFEGITLRSFSGRISLDPRDNITPMLVVSVPTATTPVTLTLIFGGDYCEGTLGAGGIGPRNAVVNGWRNVWLPRAGSVTPLPSPAAYKATHNFAFAYDGAPSSAIPAGYGHGIMKPVLVGTVFKGSYTITGKLPDGTKYTSASFYGPDGESLIYQSLHANRGSLLGALEVTPGPSAPLNNSLEGELNWFKPAPLTPTSVDRLYRAGFSIEMEAKGGTYTPPAKGQLILGLSATLAGVPNAQLNFTGAGLTGPINQPMRVATPNAISLVNTLAPTLPNPNAVIITSINAATGLITGSVGTVTVPKRRANFEALVVSSGVSVVPPPPYVGSFAGPVRTVPEAKGYFVLPQVPVAPQTSATVPMLSGQVILTPNVR